VPPYFVWVEASACENAWKSFESCSGVIPMPVSLTVKMIRGADASRVFSEASRLGVSRCTRESFRASSSGAPEVGFGEDAETGTRDACAPPRCWRRALRSTDQVFPPFLPSCLMSGRQRFMGQTSRSPRFCESSTKTLSARPMSGVLLALK
jgi:hypothetical protein